MYTHLRTREVADAEAVQKGHVLLWDFLEAHSSRVLQDSHGLVHREDSGRGGVTGHGHPTPRTASCMGSA